MAYGDHNDSNSSISLNIYRCVNIVIFYLSVIFDEFRNIVVKILFNLFAC
jgi:hypothetical protein